MGLLGSSQLWRTAEESKNKQRGVVWIRTVRGRALHNHVSAKRRPSTRKGNQRRNQKDNTMLPPPCFTAGFGVDEWCWGFFCQTPALGRVADVLHFLSIRSMSCTCSDSCFGLQDVVCSKKSFLPFFFRAGECGSFINRCIYIGIV